MTEIYIHIVARMAGYMATHPYARNVEGEESDDEARSASERGCALC